MPFGETHNMTSVKGLGNDIRFPGQWHDTETDLHYNWHRYYKPRLGRYIQADPIGLAGGMNIYSYARSNPTRFTDWLGLKTWLLVSTTGAVGWGFGSVEVGEVYLVDPTTNEAHRFTSASAGLGLGFGASLQIEAGLYDGPDDPSTISSWSLTISAFASAAKGVSGQITGTSFWGNELGGSAGYAGGAGAGIAGMLTWSHYHGKEEVIPPEVLDVIRRLLKALCL